MKAERARLAAVREAKANYWTGKRPKAVTPGRRITAMLAARRKDKTAAADMQAQAAAIRAVLGKVVAREISGKEAMVALRIDDPLSLLPTLGNFGFDALRRADLATAAMGTAFDAAGTKPLQPMFGRARGTVMGSESEWRRFGDARPTSRPPTPPCDEVRPSGLPPRPTPTLVIVVGRTCTKDQWLERRPG